MSERNTMNVLEAIQCLQYVANVDEDVRGEAARTLLNELKRMVEKRRYTLPDADMEDIVGQVLVRLCQGLPSTTHFADEGSARRYLWANLKYAALRLLAGGERRWRSSESVDDDYTACPTYRPDSRYERKRAQQHLLRYLAPLIDFTRQGLSLRRREAFQASIDDLLSRIRAEGVSTTPTLCKLRNISRDNLYQRHRRAREALMDALSAFCRVHHVPGDARQLIEDFIDRLNRRGSK